MSIQPLEMAVQAAKDALAGVEASQMSDATPCASWDVSALINHMIGAQGFFGAGITGTPPPAESDWAAGDFQAAFAEASAGLLAGFGADGALEQDYQLPFGEMSGAAFMGLAAVDTFQHAWDLCKATGQSTDLNPALASAMLEQSRAAIQEQFRGPEGAAPFGAEQPAPDGASAADQLAAFLGRVV